MNTIEKEAIEQNRLNKLQHHLFGQPIKISLVPLYIYCMISSLNKPIKTYKIVAKNVGHNLQKAIVYSPFQSIRIK